MLSFICKTIIDITKLYMSCFSGCELHLIKDIIVCYFTKYPQISIICNNKKNYLLINGYKGNCFQQVVRLVLSLILRGSWSAVVQRYIQRYNSLISPD